MLNYSKALKELRNKMYVTQEELAKILNVSFATVNRWENNIFLPSMKERKKLAELFDKYHIILEDYNYAN